MKGQLSYKWGCIVLTLLLSACASAPTWEGYSEREIADWNRINVDAATAHKFTRANLNAPKVRAWYREGFQDNDTIIEWSDEGFGASDAADWRRAGFDVDTAEEWAEHKFNAAEAERWIRSDFDLDEARENRSRGLSPTH